MMVSFDAMTIGSPLGCLRIAEQMAIETCEGRISREESESAAIADDEADCGLINFDDVVFRHKDPAVGLSRRP
jgi:hypothetical protein